MPGERPPLLERAEELGRLRARIEAARAGSGSTVVVEGPPGIGKTALLAHGGEIAAVAGCEVLRARAGQLEGELTWSLVRQLFVAVIGAPEPEREALMGGAAALAKPALGLGSGDESGTLHGLYWLTAGIAQRGPLLLAIDDAQWGDEPSLRWLAYVANRLEDLPVTMLVAIRQGERRPIALEALLARPDTELLAPRALSPEASTQLVRDAFGPAAAPAFCSSCHEASGGNPFLLHELLEQLRRDGVDADSAAPATVRTTTPTTIARSVLARLLRLPRAARELAASVAVVGGLAPLPVLAALAGLDAEAADEAAAVLTQAGVFAGALPLAFVHPVVRDVVYDDVAPTERDRRHREAARLLAGAGGSLEQVASQLMETEPAGDPWVAYQLAAAAAEAIAAGAPSTAAPLLERALREPPPGALRARLLAELGRAEARSDLEGGERMREALALTEEPADRAEIGLALGRTLGLAGNHAAAVDAFEEALLEPHEDGELRLRLEAELAGHCLHAAEKLPLGFERLATVDLDRVPESPAGHLVRAIAAFGLISAGRLDAAAAAEIATAADRGLLGLESSSLLFFVAETLVFADHLEEAGAVLDEMIATARAHGSRPGVALASAFRAQVSLRRGAVLEAQADGRTAFEVVDPEALGYCRPYALSFLLDALVERAELEEAEALVEAAGPSREWPQLWQFGLLIGSRGRLRLAQGRAGEAAEDLLECGRRLSPWRPRNPCSVPWRSDAAAALAVLGERQEAARLAGWELEHARAVGIERAVGVALRAQGVAVGGEEGVETLRAAVAALAGPTARLERARALTDLGAALRRSGARVQAREPLRQALDLALRCGSTALAARARRELADAGSRPRRTEQRGVGSLTAGELRVAQMAAAGRANREIAESLFVSLRTVETHLTRAYRKLGITSRHQLGPQLADAERDSQGAGR